MLMELEIRRERQTKEKLRTSGAVSADLGAGFALWKSAAAEWTLINCGCSQGYEVGSPPTEAARYEGQILRMLCQPVGS